MVKVNLISVLNTGLEYLVMSHGLVLCSFPTKSLANNRALELASEFGCKVCLLR